MQGRPGLNPLRFEKTYYVDQAHYDMVKSLAAVTKINASKEYSIKNGYSAPFSEGTMPFGDQHVRAG
jgi:poly-gamma-glutamate synthesis protein (capsule biosynthesis protein)